MPAPAPAFAQSSITPDQVQGYIQQNALDSGVSPALALAVAHTETGGSFDMNSYNPKTDAQGPFQTTAITRQDAVQRGGLDPKDPMFLVKAGLWNLSNKLAQNPGNVSAGLAQNEGDKHFATYPNGVQPVTSKYVPAVLAKEQYYQGLLSGATPNTPGSPPSVNLTSAGIQAPDATSDGFSLSGTLKSLAGTIQTGADWITKLASAGADVVENTLGFGKSAAQINDLSSQIETILQNAKLKTQQENAASAASLGVNSDFVNNLVSKLGPQAVATALDIAAKNKAYDDARNISFMEHPIDAIIGRISTMMLPAQVANEQRTIDENVANIIHFQELAKGQTALNNANTATVTADTILKTGQAGQIKSQQDLENAAIKAGISTAEFAKMQRQGQVEDATMSLEGTKLIQSNAVYALQKAYRGEMIEARDFKLKTEQASVAATNAAAIVGGLIKPGQVLGRSYADFSRLPKPLLLTAGYLVSDGSYGPDAATSVQTANNYKQNMQPGVALEVNQANRVVDQVIQSNIARVAEANKLPGVNQKVDDRTIMSEAQGALVGTYKVMAEDTSKVPTGLSYNSYAAPHTMAVLQADANNGGALAKTPIGKALAVAASTTPILTDQQIFDTGYNMYAQGQISRQDLAKFNAQYYKQAVKLNNKTSQYQLLKLPVQTDYRTTINTNIAGVHPDTSFFSNPWSALTNKATTQVNDLTDVATQERLLMLREAADRASLRPAGPVSGTN